MNWPGTDTGDGRRNKRVALHYWFALQTVIAVVLIVAPQAHADTEWHRYWLQWDKSVAPMGPTAAAPSADYNATRTYPPAGGQGTWQVYATPPGSGIIPSTENYCGTTTSQAQIPTGCPAGWDMWYQ